MKIRIIFLFVCFLSLITIQPALSQDKTGDSSSVSAIRTQYMKQMGVQSFLYNGEAYDRYWNAITEHPFFLEDHHFVDGRLNYDGTVYENIPMIYDINRDELVSKIFGHETDMKLLGEKVRSFTLGSHHFVRVMPDSLNSSVIGGGFYESLYEGNNINVLSKHEKKLEQSVQIGEHVSRFNEYTHYFIYKDGKYYPAESEKQLQNIFADQKSEIRKFLNRRGNNFKKDKAHVIAATAAYYEQLKNNHAS